MVGGVIKSPTAGRFARLGLALALALSHVVIGAAPADAASFTVNSTGDSDDQTPGDGVCYTGSTTVDLANECTLRAAITEANALAGPDTIVFNIPVTDPGREVFPLAYRIEPDPGLPTITGTTVIDGTSQPDFPGTPIIVIDGDDASGADGLRLQANNSEIRGLVVQEFDDDGIQVDGSNNTIAGNYVGSDVTGTSGEGNDDGILVFGSNNTIGGLNPADRNVILDNDDDGISIDGGNRNVVVGNYVGVTASGNSTVGNQGEGVSVQFGATNTTVGGSNPNVISGNDLNGVVVQSAGTSGTVVAGNRIGTNAAGTSALQNDSDGVDVTNGAANTTIGPNNLISGNGRFGIDIDPGTSGITIRGNWIGTNASGTGAVPNVSDGIYAEEDGVIIGVPGQGNLISGNGRDGIRLERLDQVVQGNLIGTQADGVSPLGNASDGIDTGSGTGGSVIGGTAGGEGNVIAYNGGRGVSFRSYPSTTGVVLGNSIHSNGALGIDLRGNGVTVNDPFDVDGGPNDLLNFPVIQSARETLGTVDVDFDLDVPFGTYRVEFFSNPGGADPTGYGEGQNYLSAVTVNHPGGGTQSFSHSFAGSVGDVLTSTTSSRCAPSPCDDVSSEFSAAFTVVPGNLPPVLDLVGPQSGPELTDIIFTATATDPDADGVAFSLSGEPVGAGITTGGDFSWTPTEAQGPGTYVFDVIVTDTGTPNLTDSETITVTVGEVNLPPVLDPIGNRAGNEGTAIAFNATASDPDLPIQPLTFSLSGEPTGAAITPGGAFTWTPSEAQGPGVYTFDVLVADDATPALTDSETISVTVSETNTAPTLAPIGNGVVSELASYSFTASATDPDDPAQALTFSLSGAPVGAAITSGGDFTWTPTEAQGPGVYAFDVVVADDGLPAMSDFETVTITVNEVNQAPSLTNPGDQINTEGDSATLSISASDADIPAAVLTFSASGLPSGLTIDAATGVMSGTVDMQGLYNVVVTVTDDLGASASVAFDWAVLSSNIAPSAGDDSYSVTEGTILTVTAPGLLANDTDPDGDALTAVVLTGPSQGVLTLNPDGSFTYMHTSSTDDDDTFTYEASDGNGGVARATVSIRVNRSNVAPVAAADTVVLFEDNIAIFNPLMNDSDADGDPLALTDLVQPGVGTITALSSGDFHYEPPANFFGETTASYKAIDLFGGSDGAVINLSIQPVNDAPVAHGDVVQLDSDDPFAIAVLANDTDIEGDSLSVVGTSTPEVGTLLVGTALITFTPPAGWSGETSFTYTVSDAAGATDVATVQISRPHPVIAAATDVVVDLSADVITIATLAPPFVAEAISLTALESVTLLAGVFYQTIGAFQLPFVFLGVSLVMLVGLGGATKVPILLAGRRREHWSVVLLDREGALHVFEEPDVSSAVIYNFNPTTESVLSTGPITKADGIDWMPVHTARGEGWVNAEYLTEQVDLDTFTEDNRPTRLVHQLADRLRSNSDVGSLIADRGVILALTGPPARLAPEQLSALLGGSRLRRLPTVGGVLHDQDDFHLAVAEPFLAAYETSPTISPETAHSKTALIPAEVWNFRYIAVGMGTEQPWLVFFEYQNGRPKIVGLGIDE